MTSAPTSDATTSIRVAVIGGDGIGPEVTDEALKVLEAAAPAKIEQTRYDLGAERYLATGEVLPDSVLDEIRGHDAILLGAVGGRPGDPRLPAGILERGLLLRLRFELDHYVNLRPSRLLPGVPSPLADPGEVDFLVVREGTEGPYTGNGGTDNGLLRKIANINGCNISGYNCYNDTEQGGLYVEANDPTQLANAFVTIASAILRLAH